ncbi:hypothetical protein MKW94_005025 [Papaver nudicaule]|uniref:RING-type E3 ubiquitin transferase n=1 Tax=Papaver nudicaule TaxID=74823 RepID=A0AA41SAY1_PAPNU|nr:hypothetical protein [Papaver nudicaule]
METSEILNMKPEIHEEDEEEEKICRICHSPGDSENPLQYPCACSGTMKFVHPKCLLRWIKQRITFECEVCKHKYFVHRVYADNTRTRLPLKEFVGGIAKKTCHVLHLCLRICVSGFYQLLMLPLLAFWTWRLSFVRSLFEARKIVHRHMSPTTFMMDWLYGTGYLLIMMLVMRSLAWHGIIRPPDEEVAENRAHIAFPIINGVLITVPLSLGRILLHCLSWCFSAGESLSSVGKQPLLYRSSALYDVITLATGYMVVVSLAFAYSGIPIRTVTSKIRYYLRKFLTTMVHIFFLIIYLGVLHLVNGWWLDVCTITMLGKTISDRVDFFSKFPLLSSSMHWALGIVYMFQIHISISLLQRILRREVLYFLQDLADPLFIVFRVLTGVQVQVQASQFLFSIVVNGILIVFLVYLPVVLAIQSAPTIFPLHISVSDPFTEIPVVMLLFQICLPCSIELRKTVEALLHQWVTAVCSVLGLSGFLCSRPEDIGAKEKVKVERRQDSLIAAQDPNNNISTSQNFGGVENYAGDAIANGYTFVLRVVLLVVLAWITLFLLYSSLIIVSLPLGRVLFSSIFNLLIAHGIKCNDLYAFFIGNFSIWTFFTGARYFIEYFKARKAHLQFNEICKLFCIIIETCVLLSLWIIVIPVLTGLLFEFSIMVPIRASVVEFPVLFLYQDWAVGFYFFKLWRTLVLLNHRILLVDESWRNKFERVSDNDFLKVPGHWMMQEILIPVVMTLLTSLCFPYIFARWIVPSLGFSQTVNSIVYRFTWVAYVTIIVLFSCAKKFPAWITNLHSSIRDDLYSSLGLQNFGEVITEYENEIGKLVRWPSQSQGR